MKNILVRLDDQTYEELKLRAKGTHVSMAGLVREATARYLAGEGLRADDPIFSLGGGINVRKDGARRHDRYIYDKKD